MTTSPLVAPLSSRRRRWKRRFTNHLARWFGLWLYRALARTWRIQFVNLDMREALHRANTPPVIPFWHQQIPAAIASHRGYPVHVLISQNRDGAMIADFALRLGFQAVRGSSSKGAKGAVRKMLELAKGPDALGFTPDGPRGPLHSVAPGVIFVAATSRRPILAVGFAASRYWQAKSWDRMVIPKPFARIAVAYDDSMGIPCIEATQAGVEQEKLCAHLKKVMDSAEAAAKASLQPKPRLHL